MPLKQHVVFPSWPPVALKLQSLSENQRTPRCITFILSVILLLGCVNGQLQKVSCADEEEIFLASSAEECSNQNDTLSRTQYTFCSDSSFIYDGVISNCPKENCTSPFQQCWNGNCASNLTRCPPIPRCPPMHQRCSDGSCVYGVNCTSTLTCEGGKIVCLDGAGKPGCYDAPCPFPFYGCPVNGGFLCPSGECVRNLSVCQDTCPSGYFFCWDQLCYPDPSACSVPGFILSYPNFTVEVDPTIENIISAKATSERDDVFNQPIFSLTIPPGTFTKRTSISFHTSPESEISTFIPPQNWVDNRNLSAYYLNIYSAVVKFWMDPALLSNQQNILFTLRAVLPLKSTTQSSDLCFGIIKKKTWTCIGDVTFGIAQNQEGRVFVLNGTLPSGQIESLNWAAILRKNNFLTPPRIYETIGGGIFFGVYILISIILVVLLAHRRQPK